MTYITIVNDEEEYGTMMHIGMTLTLIKDPGSDTDDECIRAVGEHGIPMGIVANSVEEVYRGTHSAGYIHHMFEEKAQCRVMFMHDEYAIAQMLEDGAK